MLHLDGSEHEWLTLRPGEKQVLLLVVAWGRSERWNGTWQGNLVAELRLAGIDNLTAANRFIAARFLPGLNRQFAQEAAEPGSAFGGAQRRPGPDLRHSPR
jgi:hypothetical protein